MVFDELIVFLLIVLLDYLREESNMLPRIGAVAIGGLTGLIFSLRGGRFKRLVYTTTGVLTVAGVCYPKEAGETFVASKHYVNIGYNFIYGGELSRLFYFLFKSAIFLFKCLIFLFLSLIFLFLYFYSLLFYLNLQVFYFYFQFFYYYFFKKMLINNC